MEPIKILIVEDERLTALRMKRTLEKEGHKITDLPISEEQAIAAIDKETPDLIIMDIKLNAGIEGITAAQKIKKSYSIPIIFITQLTDEEIFKQAKATFPQSYLTKPYNDNDLVHAVALAIQNSGNWIKNRKIKVVEQVNDSIFLLPNGSHVKTKLPNEAILYIKSSGSYSEIHYETAGKIAENPYKVSLSSNHVVKQIASETIIKVHKSYYVNTKKIQSFKKSCVFIHGIKIPVSDSFHEAVKLACKSIEHNIYKKNADSENKISRSKNEY